MGFAQVSCRVPHRLLDALSSGAEGLERIDCTSLRQYLALSRGVLAPKLVRGCVQQHINTCSCRMFWIVGLQFISREQRVVVGLLLSTPCLGLHVS